MDVQIDNKKMWKSLIRLFGTYTNLSGITQQIIKALKEQGLTYDEERKEIVSIEPECIIEEGKWFMCLNNEGVEDEFTTGKVYHALRDNVLINDMREMSFWSNNTKRFRPATPEEISTIVDRPAAKEEIKKAHRNCNAPIRDNYNEIKQAEPEQEASEELTEFERYLWNITNLGEPDEKELSELKIEAKGLLSIARKQIASQLESKIGIYNTSFGYVEGIYTKEDMGKAQRRGYKDCIKAIKGE